MRFRLAALLSGLCIVISAVPLFAGAAAEAEPSVQTFSEKNPVRVFVSVQPQKYFVERVGGSRVSVEVLVEPGRDPHSYDPSPRQLTSLSRADVFFSIGMPFESTLIPKLVRINPRMRVVDTLEGIEFLPAPGHGHEEDTHAEEIHEEDHDPHVWLGPREVRKQIQNIHTALSELDRDGAEDYAVLFNEFDAEIRQMDRNFAELLAPVQGSSILVFHPSFGYFTNSYGIHQKTIELDGKEPSPRHLETLIDQAMKDGIRVILTQPEFPVRSAEIIAEAIDGTVVSMNPLDPDWTNLMNRLAETIARAAY